MVLEDNVDGLEDDVGEIGGKPNIVKELYTDAEIEQYVTYPEPN